MVCCRRGLGQTSAQDAVVHMLVHVYITSNDVHPAAMRPGIVYIHCNTEMYLTISINLLQAGGGLEAALEAQQEEARRAGEAAAVLRRRLANLEKLILRADPVAGLPVRVRWEVPYTAIPRDQRMPQTMHWTSLMAAVDLVSLVISAFDLLPAFV